jgi:DNA-directed RNA polymerase subunit RPC12/RpoP
VPRCPRCATALDGGPVAYYCARCGRGVMAADLDTDYHPPRRLVPVGGEEIRDD